MIDELTQEVARTAKLPPAQAALAVKAVLRFFTARLPSRLVGEMHACLKKSVLPQQSAVLPPSEQAE
ncbi:MAG: hypothetical protein IPP10_18535 [Candidatus Competibacteraceae bacterium]|nr:hypothetical protein [Candidatus Competibacteraceae bacterium]MBK8962670.1 hypothetical protein [Candidatus Competibacteraceae bacterium]MBK9953404.1 hypothetical protein [Candidatus Competibacteraceae bacterium]